MQTNKRVCCAAGITRGNFFLAVSLYLFASFQNACATDYALGYGMNLSAKHDDNIRLVNADKTAISGTVASPSFSFNASNETSSLGLNATMNLARYDDNDFNSNDINASGAWNTQLERSSIGIDLIAIRDSTTTSEIRDSGRIGAQADRHEHYAAAPSWGYQITELDSIKLRASAGTDNYGDSEAYQGYRTWDASLDWTHALGETLRAILRVTHSDYRSDEQTQTVPVYGYFDFGGNIFLEPIGSVRQSTSTQSRSSGGLAGFDYLLSEQNTLTFLVGASRVTTDYALKDPNMFVPRRYCFRRCATGRPIAAIPSTRKSTGTGPANEIRWP
jgi:hypothetical protein